MYIEQDSFIHQSLFRYLLEHTSFSKKDIHEWFQIFRKVNEIEEYSTNRVHHKIEETDISSAQECPKGHLTRRRVFSFPFSSFFIHPSLYIWLLFSFSQQDHRKIITSPTKIHFLALPNTTKAPTKFSVSLSFVCSDHVSLSL